MAEKTVLTMQERPESDVYITDSGFVGIRQTVRGEESIVLFTPDEAEKIAASLLSSVKTLRTRSKK